MAYPNDQKNPAARIPVYLAGAAQLFPTPPTPFPATIAAGVTYNSGPILSGGYPGIAVAAKLNQTGIMTVQRYMDLAGTIPVGDLLSDTMSSGNQSVIWANDGVPFASFVVTIQNTSGALGTLSNTSILIGG